VLGTTLHHADSNLRSQGHFVQRRWLTTVFIHAPLY